MNPALYLETFLGGLEAQHVTNVFLVVLAAVFLLATFLARVGRVQGFVHYAPNMLTSLGILGTFVGIVVGLIGFDVNAIDASIGMLLAGLKTAFITSLVGILLAILFKAAETSGLLRRKTVETAVEHVGPEEIHNELRAQREAVEKLSRAIAGDEEATLITQIRLLRSDSRDEANRAREVLEQQRELQSGLAESANAQTQRFDSFTQELWTKLDDFAEMLSKSATEQVINALKEVIADFNQNLTEQFGENFKELNVAVEKLVQWQENYRVQLEQMGEQYAQGVQAITATETSVAHISEESKQIPVAMGELKTVLTTTQHQLAELERHLEAFRDMRDRAVEAVPQIQQQMDAMVKDVSSAVKDAGEQIVIAGRAVNLEIVEGAMEFQDRVHRTNEGLTNASDQLVKNSELIREQLEDTVSEVNEHVRNMASAVSENTKTVADNLVKSNKALETNIKEVQFQVTDSIEKMQKRLESALEEVFQAQTHAMSRSFAAVDEELRKSVGTTGEAVTKQLEAMDSAMQQELERVIGALGQKLAGVTRKFTEDYSQLTDQMATVVGQARRFEDRARTSY